MSGEPTEWDRECAKRPGSRWRIDAYGPGDEAFRAENQGTFNEVVVDHWLHVEQMENRLWIVRIGQRGFSVYVNADGSVELNEAIEEDEVGGD